MAIVRLAFLSVLNRRVTAGLTLLAIALSVAMLLGVEKVRRDARGAFANTISGTDLIVGARSGAIQLLLYSVFRIGNATSNISWESYRDIASFPRVRWTVPILLGDSHRGFRVMGTTRAYFEHYRYARTRSLAFDDGGPFDDVFDAVLGAEVAQRLGYALGDELVVSHGAGEVSFVDHDDKPFRAVGILAATGTPVDRTVHVSVEGFTAMHVDWRAGVRVPGSAITADEARADGSHSEDHHRVPGGPRYENRHLWRAAANQRVPRGTTPRDHSRCRAAGNVGPDECCGETCCASCPRWS